MRSPVRKSETGYVFIRSLTTIFFVFGHTNICYIHLDCGFLTVCSQLTPECNEPELIWITGIRTTLTLMCRYTNLKNNRIFTPKCAASWITCTTNFICFMRGSRGGGGWVTGGPGPLPPEKSQKIQGF